MKQLTRPQDLSRLLGIDFSAEQLAAICAPLRPNTVAAGAGSGKTTVMAARVVWLVGTGQIRADQALGLTFTNKAAAELNDRILSALTKAGLLQGQQEQAGPVAYTYDAFAGQLVSEFGMLLALSQDQRLVTGVARFQLAARALRSSEESYDRITRLAWRTLLTRVLELDSQLGSHLVTGDQLREFTEAATRRFAAGSDQASLPKPCQEALAALQERLELLDLAERYQQLKQQHGIVEYADQLRSAVQLAETVPAVGQALRARYQVALLDEYQDTSVAQVRLLAALFGRDSGFAVTAVGDSRQAIYGWRGAAADALAQFDREFVGRSTETQHFQLSINRRSGERILAVGNALAASQAAAGVSLRAPAGAVAGEVDAAGFTTEAEEAAWLAEQVWAEHESGTPWSEIAVLLRRNSGIASIREALLARDIPVEVAGLAGLLQLPEIVPVVATLRLLAGVGRQQDVVALLTSQRWRIGPADLRALGRRARYLARQASPQPGSPTAASLAAGEETGSQSWLLDAVADPGPEVSPEARARLRDCYAELQGLRQYHATGITDLIWRIAEVSGLTVELLAWAPQRTKQLAALAASVTQYRQSATEPDLLGFVSYLEAELEYGTGLPQADFAVEDSVKLLSVHRAKGLEWQVVFLPQLAADVFPGAYRSGTWVNRAETLPSPLRGDAPSIAQLSQHNADGISDLLAAVKQEHRAAEDRLAYVAATRAKRRLAASWHVWEAGKARPKQPSPYFTEIAKQATAVIEPVAPPKTNPAAQPQLSVAWPEQSAWESGISEGQALVEQAATAAEDWVWRGQVATQQELQQLARWDANIEALIAQRQPSEPSQPLPPGLTASELVVLGTRPDGFAQQLVRRMPRRPQRAAQLGTQFHAWVQERFGDQPELDLVELQPPRPPELEKLIRCFEQGQFASRIPAAVEVAFEFPVGQHVVRGQIDAVYREKTGHWLIVDWKTGSSGADPIQLAVYRRAWALTHDVPEAEIRVGFYHVAKDQLELVEPPEDAIEQLLRKGGKQ